jgi:hypothetical protein
MSKRNKSQSKAGNTRSASPTAPGHPPIKQPVGLAVSVILLALWFVFLIVTALSA